MEEVFKLSRRKGTNKWNVRKRYPLDVAPILKGEFNKSTGEEDKKRAQYVLIVEGSHLFEGDRVNGARLIDAAIPSQFLQVLKQAGTPKRKKMREMTSVRGFL